MAVIRLCAVALLCALACVVLKRYCPEQAFLLTLAACAAIVFYALPLAAELYGTIQAICGEAAPENAVYILKALGICILTQTGARVCADYGQSALALQLETAGKFAVLIVSLPLIRRLLEILSGLLG